MLMIFHMSSSTLLLSRPSALSITRTS
jgi:hypothetical protein